MADFIYDRSLGSIAELYNRVKGDSPANSAFVICALVDSPVDTDASLRVRQFLSGVLSVNTSEASNSNYARKVLTESDLVAFSFDTVNHRVDLDLPDQTWTAVAAGDDWGDVVISYDADTTSGTDANITPMCQFDFDVSPDGNDITLQFGADGFFRAEEA